MPKYLCLLCSYKVYHRPILKQVCFSVKSVRSVRYINQVFNFLRGILTPILFSLSLSHTSFSVSSCTTLWYSVLYHHLPFISYPDRCSIVTVTISCFETKHPASSDISKTVTGSYISRSFLNYFTERRGRKSEKKGKGLVFYYGNNPTVRTGRHWKEKRLSSDRARPGARNHRQLRHEEAQNCSRRGNHRGRS